MGRRGITSVLVLLLWAGCGKQGSGRPVVELVSPSSTPAGTTPSVIVTGGSFFSNVAVDLSGESPAQIESEFSALLRVGEATDVALEQVQWMNASTLSAVVPPGLAVGSYDLIVVGPTGASNRLEGAFTVCADEDGDGVCGCVDPQGNRVCAPPMAVAGSGVNIREGEAASLDASASVDTNGMGLSYGWDLNGDGIYGDVVGETPTVVWPTLRAFGIDDNGSYPIALEVNDGFSTHRDTTTIEVEEVPPTLVTTGAPAVGNGQSYVLNLEAVDPGADTVSEWVVNWGDGAIDRYSGNPASVTHVYTRTGFTSNILASASDEDGSYLQNDFVVGSSVTDSLMRYEATTGNFVQEFATSDGMGHPIDLVVGPSGDIYVTGTNSDNVLRYDGITGAFVSEFVTAGSGGLNEPAGLVFGADGHLYVASFQTDEVLRYHGETGAFIDVFADAPGGGIDAFEALVFGPDGNLFVGALVKDAIQHYEGDTGITLGNFVNPKGGGLDEPEGMTFGPDGHLYVVSDATDSVLRYNGTTGLFIDEFVAAGAGSLQLPTGVVFGPDGNLYVGSWLNHKVLRFDGATGAFIDEYVPASSGGLTRPYYGRFLPKQQTRTTAGAANQFPTAHAGPSQTIDEGDSLTLDASASSDPESDPLTYTWDIDGTGGFDDAQGVSPSLPWSELQSRGFRAPGVYDIRVRAEDGQGGRDRATTRVRVRSAAR